MPFLFTCTESLEFKPLECAHIIAIYILVTPLSEKSKVSGKFSYYENIQVALCSGIINVPVDRKTADHYINYCESESIKFHK
jgi:hypothetical protein